MNKQDRKYAPGPRFVYVLLIGLFLSSSLFADSRRGSILDVAKTDGTKIRGELIAVRGNSILLADEQAGYGTTVMFGEIQNLVIVKKAHVWTGAGIGLLGGTALGRLLGSSGGHTWGPDMVMLEGVGIGAITGVVLGIAAAAGLGEDIKLIKNGYSRLPERALLKKLKSMARIPDAD